MFKRVRNSLSIDTEGNQISWEHTSLMGDFYFCISAVSTDVTFSYSQLALCDFQFISSRNIASSLINDLKSHNWYIQNPASNKIPNILTDTCSIDELFVLGRNIYQAACGYARDLTAYVNNLEENISNLPDEKSIHILNGCLFEIYFDSHGDFRKNFKSTFFLPVLSAALSERYQPCSVFINSYLSNYTQRIFYFVGDTIHVVLNIVVKRYDDLLVVEEIIYNGTNTLANTDGEPYPIFNRDDDFYQQYTKEEVIQDITTKTVIPRNYLDACFVGDDIGVKEKILLPYQYKLVRFFN